MNTETRVGLSRHLHPTLYTVVEETPDALKVSRFEDPVDAQRYLEKIRMMRPGSFLLPPGTNP